MDDGQESKTKDLLIPQLRPGIDLVKVGLSLEEGFVASRIDGQTSVNDIAHLVGKSAVDVFNVLERLAKAGVIVLDKRKVKLQDRKGDGPDSDYGNTIFSPGLMQETCDLEVEERKRIIWFYEHLETWNHYEVLKAKRRDDAKTLKRAYYDRSKEWHPDRFRRPNLGSFGRMIEAIFKRIQEAHKTLSNSQAREDYDKGIVFMPDEDDVAEMLQKQKRLERESKRENETIERRKRRNPMRKRIGQAKKFFDEAEAHYKDGDLMAALRAAQTCVAFEARDDYVAFVERLKVEAGEFRIGPAMKRGKHQENMTNWTEAVEAFQSAVDMAPDHGPARLRLAYNLLMGGRSPQEASNHAQKAASLIPEDAEAHFVLGLCYEKGGMEKAAIRALSKALELKPNYAQAKKRLKKLRWGF